MKPLARFQDGPWFALKEVWYSGPKLHHKTLRLFAMRVLLTYCRMRYPLSYSFSHPNSNSEKTNLKTSLYYDVKC